MKQILLSLLLIAGLPLSAAAQITGLNTFSPSTRILSADVNFNFTKLADEALRRQGGTLTGNITANAGVQIDGIDLSSWINQNLSTTATVQFSGATVSSLTVTTGTATINTQLALPSGTPIRFNGAGGSTFIYESAPNVLTFASVGGGAALSSSVLSVNGFGTHVFSSAGTGSNRLRVRNTASGTGDIAGLEVGNDGDASAGQLLTMSSTYPTTGDLVAWGTSLRAHQSGGLSIAATHASGAVRFYSGSGILRGAFGSTGQFNTTLGIQVNTSGTVVSSFADGITMGGYDALGYDSGGTKLVLGGYRSSQWASLGFYTSGSEKMTLSTTGVLSVLSPGIHSFSGATNGDNVLVIANSNAGSSARAYLRLSGDGGDSYLIKHSSTNVGGVTATGNELLLLQQQAAPLALAATHASGTIRFYTGGTSERMSISNTGTVTIANDASIGVNLGLGGYITGFEQSTPALPPADNYRLFAKDNGSGKTQLCVIFSSGAAQCFATQP